jgi:hypothetical protein
VFAPLPVRSVPLSQAGSEASMTLSSGTVLKTVPYPRLGEPFPQFAKYASTRCFTVGLARFALATP